MLSAAGCGKKPAPPAPPPSPSPTATPTPVPTPTPIPSIPRKPLSTARLFNGLGLQSKVTAAESDDSASQDRRDIDAYRVEINVNIRLPKASTTAEELAKNDPLLPGLFKDLRPILDSARVSPAFSHLYKLKVAQVQRQVGQLDEILSRHNFYDCETILELQHPQSKSRALLFISDMDVNTDGSDGDRNVQVDGSSPYFLPQTSFRWPKQTERANPFVAVEEKRMANLKSELPGVPADSARANTIREAIATAKQRIFDMKKWSFLVSETDPFIVLPGFMLRDKDNAFTTGFGDYAIVLHDGRAYPAIVGDAGPSFKIGEASLLLCRELNARSSANNRPVSELKVAYLVFPGSAAAQPAPPDLAAWQARCTQLVEEFGGLTVDLHEWTNLVKPWPTPTPTPTPLTTPTPSPGASPATEPQPPFVNDPPPVPVVTSPASAD
jgi:hypothetical protein